MGFPAAIYQPFSAALSLRNQIEKMAKCCRFWPGTLARDLSKRIDVAVFIVETHLTSDIKN